MSATLFAPDLFSSPRPTYKPADHADTALICKVLEAHYGRHDITVQDVQGLDGLEINSRNFRVTAQDGRVFALKRTKPGTPANALRVQLSVSQKLRANGIALPGILPADDDSLCPQDAEGRIWVLFGFMDGPYFGGLPGEMQKTAQAVASFQYALDSLPDAQNLPLSAATSPWQDTVKILDTVLSDGAALDQFPGPESNALQREADILKHSIAGAGDYKTGNAAQPAGTHIDLHPHNILIAPDGTPAIVDLDSLQRADRVQSLAFAAFKLGRQRAVVAGPAEAAGETLGFLETLGFAAARHPECRMAATAEVLRRIGIIFDLNMSHRNTAWNSVLHIQLAALHEIPHLFGVED